MPEGRTRSARRGREDPMESPRHPVPSPSRPPRPPRPARPSTLALQGDTQRPPRIERLAEPADELAHAFAIRPEVADLLAQLPWRALERHGDFARRGGPSDRAKAFG